MLYHVTAYYRHMPICITERSKFDPYRERVNIVSHRRHELSRHVRDEEAQAEPRGAAGQAGGAAVGPGGVQVRCGVGERGVS